MQTTSTISAAAAESALLVDERVLGYRARLVGGLAQAIQAQGMAGSAQARRSQVEKIVHAIADFAAAQSTGYTS